MNCSSKIEPLTAKYLSSETLVSNLLWHVMFWEKSFSQKIINRRSVFPSNLSKWIPDVVETLWDSVQFIKSQHPGIISTPVQVMKSLNRESSSGQSPEWRRNYSLNIDGDPFVVEAWSTQQMLRCRTRHSVALETAQRSVKYVDCRLC